MQKETRIHTDKLQFNWGMSLGFRKKCLERVMTEGLEKQEVGVFKGSQSEPEEQQKLVGFLNSAGSRSVELRV